jgi:hypothetical protein
VEQLLDYKHSTRAEAIFVEEKVTKQLRHSGDRLAGQKWCHLGAS